LLQAPEDYRDRDGYRQDVVFEDVSRLVREGAKVQFNVKKMNKDNCKEALKVYLLNTVTVSYCLLISNFGSPNLILRNLFINPNSVDLN
jgi:hypothetical protein